MLRKIERVSSWLEQTFRPISYICLQTSPNYNLPFIFYYFFTTKVGFEIMMIAILGCDSRDFVVSCHFMDYIENN